jgi:hypothetical protein
MRFLENFITAIMFTGIGLVLGAVLREPVYITNTVFVDVPGPAIYEEIIVEPVAVPSSDLTSVKTYMDYRKITKTDSAQYKLIHSDAIVIDDRGFLVTEDGYIGVALGTYFGPIGSKFIFTFEDGHQLKLIKVEVKSDAHTCDHNILDGSGAAIEFVIDSKTSWMNAHRGANGLIFNGNFNAYFNGKIKTVNRVVG